MVAATFADSTRAPVRRIAFFRPAGHVDQ